jgi:hypothetical protein
MPSDLDGTTFRPDDLPPIPSRFRRFPRKLVILACVVSVPLLLIWWVFPLPSERITYSEPKQLQLDPARMSAVDDLIRSHSRGEKITGNEGDPLVQRKDLFYTQDINGDGRLDAISWNASRILVSKWGGSMSFPILMAPSQPEAVGFDDIDGDGYIDAWIVDPGDCCTQIAWGRRLLPFFRFQFISTGLKTFPMGAFYDVDDDGDLDHVLKDDDGKFWWIELEPIQ